MHPDTIRIDTIGKQAIITRRSAFTETIELGVVDDEKGTFCFTRVNFAQVLRLVGELGHLSFQVQKISIGHAPSNGAANEAV